MPKVAQYSNNQESTQVVTGAKASAAGAGGVRPVKSSLPGLKARLNRNDRTAELDRQGKNAIVGGVLDAASTMAKAAAEFKQRANETAAEEALLRFERDKNKIFFDPDSGYFNTQGRNAYDSGEATLTSLGKLKSQYGENLDQGARDLFEKAAKVHISRATVDVHRHASKGFKAWEAATTQAQVENTLENASFYFNQPDQLAVQNNLGRQAIMDQSKREGIGSEATAERLQTFDSEFAKATISAAVSRDSATGKAALEAYGELLEGPLKRKFEVQIEKSVKAEKTGFNAQQAVLKGTRLSDIYDDRESIRSEVNKISDPKLRKSTMREAMYQFDLKRKAEKEAQGDAFEAVEEHLLNGGSVETFKASNSRAWNRMTAKQRKSLMEDKAVETDWNTYSNLMTKSPAELAKVDPVDYYEKLGITERKALITAVKSAKGKATKTEKVDSQVGRTRAAQVKTALVTMFGKENDRSEKERTKVEAFYSLLDEEVGHRESEGALTSEQFTQVLSELTRKVAIEKSFLSVDRFWPDSEASVADMDAEDVTALSRFLRDNNIPVTAENLVKAQRQAKK